MSQAVDWAEQSSKEWASIFQDALTQRTEFTKTCDALPVSGRVPEFHCFLNGKVDRGTLRASGVFELEVRTSPAGLVKSNATTSSQCLLAIESPVRAYFDNNYPRYPEGTSHLRVTPLESLNSLSITDTPSIPNNTTNEPNYLALLTLAWGYVLSAYWTATQNGKICYTESKAPYNSSSLPDRLPRRHILHLNTPPTIHFSNELQWWRAVLAPGRGWEAKIDRQGQTWLSPWTVENDPESEFFIVTNNDSNLDVDEPPGFQQAHDILVEFTLRRGLQCQSSVALMAALNIPTHNLWSLPLRLPRPRAMSRYHSASAEDTATFQRLRDQIPQLVTVALFGVESILRSGFFTESIHSLSSGQWLQPAVVSWPDSSAFAAEIGCKRSPELAKWWIGMAVSGMLSRKSVVNLVGDGMWPTNLGACIWMGATDSHFCTVFDRDVGIRVRGSGKWATIPRAEEALILFTTSGDGPQGNLIDPPICPWRPPGDVRLELSKAKVIEMAHINATIRLYYNDWRWDEGPRAVDVHSPAFHSASFDQMVESSGAVTRALLGWLEDMRGSEADFNPELEGLKDQIRRVEEDEDVGGSNNLSDDTSIVNPTSDHHLPSLRGNVGQEFDDVELIDSWNGDINEFCGDGSFGWCGLDAINSGLSQLDLSPISKGEAVRILSVTERGVEQDGLSINQLEALLNTKGMSVAIIDISSKKLFRLRTAKHKNSLITIGFCSAPHFIGLEQKSRDMSVDEGNEICRTMAERPI